MAYSRKCGLTPLTSLNEKLIESFSSAESLLVADPQKRADGSTLKDLELFQNVNWKDILNTEAPFIPQPKDHTDTTYFQARNCLQNLRVSQIDF